MASERYLQRFLVGAKMRMWSGPVGKLANATDIGIWKQPFFAICSHCFGSDFKPRCHCSNRILVPAGTPQRGGLGLSFDGSLPDLGRLSRHADTMPRAMRVEFPGAIYYVMDRGDRREDICIFAGQVDRGAGAICPGHRA